MRRFLRLFLCAAWIMSITGVLPAWATDTFSVASYNLENYVNTDGPRGMKSDASKAKIREGLLKLNADVLALQEVGGREALEELRLSLRSAGLEYPYWEFVSGHDTNIHVAVLSRFPIIARRPHTNDGFLINGRRFRISRGIAEVDVRVRSSFKLTLFVVHLKSRREVPEADQAELREHEAAILRRYVDDRLNSDPDIDLALVGDLNDTRNSRSVRSLIGRGARGLIDTRPAERNGDSSSNLAAHLPPRNIAWTHYYAMEDTYSRIDYILVSRHLSRKLIRDGTYVLAVPDWGTGSDHRPIVAEFSEGSR